MISNKKKETYMQVLVSTFGKEGIQRLADADYPKVDGLEYIVCWQLPDGDCDIPESLAARDDMKIYKTTSRGLSRNRNEAIAKATAHVVMIADDDLHYDAEALSKLMEYHRMHSSDDIVCAHITENGKRLPTYADIPFSLSALPKGYYFVSCELSFKREPLLASGVKFSELLGIGAPELIVGEEEAFMHQLLKKGFKGSCVPIVVADHPQSSTGERIADSDAFIKTRGALVLLKYPSRWKLQLPITALYTSRSTKRPFFKVWKLLNEGVKYAKEKKLFD